MEDPAFVRAAGTLAGRRILDLGCGDGTFARACVAAGCSSYVGIDGSRRMIERARASGPTAGIHFERVGLEDYEPPPGSFDLVSARMVLHYLDDLDAVVAKARRALDVGGRFVFTVVHPVITAASHELDGPRWSQLVAGYFEPGARRRQWFGRPVTWQHRTIEQYLGAVVAAGFVLDAFSECPPHEHLFDGHSDEFRRRLQVPLFLLIGATAPAASTDDP
jgi:SAM-dependent methyltransferase